MSNYILLIYPLVVLILLVIGAKIAPKGTFHEEFLSLKSTKVLQGAASLGIILHHLVQQVTSYGAVWKGPITHMNWMGVLFTAIFFFFSGYGLLKSYQTKTDYLDTFLEKRMPAVLIPFLISNIIYFFCMGLYTGKIIRVTDALTSLVGFTLLNTNTWFLVEIILFYIAFYIIYKRVKEPGKALGLMTGFVLLTIVISLLLGHDYSEMNGHWFMGEWWYNSTIVFVFGMLMARYEAVIVKFAKKHYMWSLPLAVIFFVEMYILSEDVVQEVGYYCEWEGHPGYKEKAITAFVQSMTCILFMVTVVLLCMKVRFYNIIIAYVGKISLALYIMHDLMKHNILRMSEEMSDPKFFIIVFIDSFIFASALHFLINQKLIEFWENYREKCKQEPETLEAKQKWLRRKAFRKKLRVWLILIGVVLMGIVLKEAYTKYIVPGKHYKEQVETLASAQVGDMVYYGTYDIEPLWTGERIEWIVAERQADKVLLVSVYGLEGEAFQKEYEATDWEASSIREILNSDFVDMAFTEQEQELITTTRIVTEANSQYGTSGGSFTYDKVFLLSVEEAEKYFTDDEARRLAPTTMAGRRGANMNPREGSSWWWLRTMGEKPDMAATVNIDGEINLEGERVNIVSGVVRPAMWVTIE